MFSRDRKIDHSDSLVPLAEAIADAFESIGDQRAAHEVLEFAARHGVSDGLALRQAEHAFGEGDANRALNALIPAWEAGSTDSHLEAQMGLASLALGLYDVVETLTAQDDLSLEHTVLRWILAAWDDLEKPVLDVESVHVVWLMRAQLMTLAACGRTDLVYRAVETARAMGAEGLASQMAGIPATEPAKGRPAALPNDAREPFADRWRHPAHDAVFSWAYSSARQVFEGERVVVLAPDATHFSCLLGHGQASYVSEGPETRNESLAPGQFEHVIAIFDANLTVNPAQVVQEYARALTHEGQLHLLVAGPGLAQEFDLALSLKAAERLCTDAGLVSLGADARDATGLPVAPEQASVHLVRAEKRVV